MNKPYDTAEILRQNVADLEKELQRQRDRADKAELRNRILENGQQRLRDQIERVTGEWERAEAALASARDDLQSWVDSRNEWMARAEAAEAELAKAREQEPVAVLFIENGRIEDVPDQRGLRVIRDGNLTVYAAPIPAPAPAVTEEWREVMAELAADLQASIEAEHAYRNQYSSVMRKYQNDMRIVERARALLQSAGGAK